MNKIEVKTDAGSMDAEKCRINLLLSLLALVTDG